MITIVADTNIIISAYNFKGNPARVIDKAVTGEINMAISEPILVETRRVLRDKFGWPAEDLTELEAVIAVYTVRVNPTRLLNVVPDDPDDNRILECAATAEADYIITGDKHLLTLRQFGKIRIVTPADFLQAEMFQVY